MKAFVTGGTGFLGFHVIKQLLANNWQVTAMHRHNSNVADLEKLGVTLVEGTLADINELQKIVPDDLDAIFHIAGDTNMWACNNERQFQVNVIATQNLVEVALQKKVKRFIHTSSISAYGFHTKTITEDDKSTAMQSNINYLKTKYSGEKIVKDAVHFRKLDAVILNPCAIIGSHDKQNWSQLFTMINNGDLPGVPSGEGSYCHVDEVAAAHIAAFEKGKIGENYILAGTDCAFLEVVTKIGKLLGKDTPNKTVPQWLLSMVGYTSYWLSLLTKKEPTMTPEKAIMVSKRVVASSHKSVTELGYVDNISIDVMLEDCYLWMKSEQLI
ncbi:NAD-dependent epimerase/dehydratase family protein [uncultured Psychrosphaera sp.]|uniref:NAD-dependent epimerase/dehydratase family protein n=1 Tax=uncultured Psychrosphaera sp. TaxID=1403522 RepID=UPI00262598FC|nr:NAD-dependent epimerase/dehydratase family protein [uncultured Psychrosphaera sp.]